MVDFATVSEELKEMLVGQKMAKTAPAYIEKLKKDDDVEIVDPSLKAMSDSLSSADTNSPAATPDK